jgi:hypothetical protein
VDPEQAHFAAFQARVGQEPAQCLRYCFDAAAQPLWPSSKNVPGPADIPPCERCGSPRQFEFQVMPQVCSRTAFCRNVRGACRRRTAQPSCLSPLPYPAAAPPPRLSPAPPLLSTQAAARLADALARTAPPGHSANTTPHPPAHPHPQLIVHLGMPADDPAAPDWGTIAVYSCAAACGGGGAGAASPDESAYLEEFVWVQESA